MDSVCITMAGLHSIVLMRQNTEYELMKSSLVCEYIELNLPQNNWVTVCVLSRCSLLKTFLQCLAAIARRRQQPRQCLTSPTGTATSSERAGRTSWTPCCSCSGPSCCPKPWSRWRLHFYALQLLHHWLDHVCLMITLLQPFLVEMSDSFHSECSAATYCSALSTVVLPQVEDFVEPNGKISLQREETPSNR